MYTIGGGGGGVTCLWARSALAGCGAGLGGLSSCETPAEKFKRVFGPLFCLSVTLFGFSSCSVVIIGLLYALV